MNKGEGTENWYWNYYSPDCGS